MKINRRSLLAAAATITGSATIARADESSDGLSPLTNQPSRAELFARMRAAELSTDPTAVSDTTHYFNLYGPFRFPNDALYDVSEQKQRQNSIFGIDVSHYTSKNFPIEELKQRQVRFLYMKASQGRRLYDAKFSDFYARTINLPTGSQVHAGAYHFLSSADDGVDQARTFLKILRANGALTSGKLRATDMPPVVDMEWDVAVANGPDRWQGRKPAQIVAQARAFLEEVQRETGRTPMIYTAKAWWTERIGKAGGAELAAYPLWIADYSRSSRASESPPGLSATAPWTLWQFTEAATMALADKASFDASIYKGSADEFYRALGVRAFT
jgi:lysozyme